MQIDERALKAAMKQMGIKQQELDASEVIIKIQGKELVIKNPKVVKITMNGKDSFQIDGTAVERLLDNEEDIKMVMEKANVSREEAKKALASTNGDMAEAILQLQQ